MPAIIRPLRPALSSEGLRRRQLAKMGREGIQNGKSG